MPLSPPLISIVGVQLFRALLSISTPQRQMHQSIFIAKEVDTHNTKLPIIADNRAFVNEAGKAAALEMGSPSSVDPHEWP
jgi:hypothetical protein